ncbi:hypothetical protein [Rhodococcus pyridinivorans]|uniref:hypothetical protein n=1 Tax=Rhodococcus pyridinivorans TaxID=103816 RepID=UPI0026595669|nr:hypothetical protein [Rhodococcus pyridinivorans]
MYGIAGYGLDGALNCIYVGPAEGLRPFEDAVLTLETLVAVATEEGRDVSDIEETSVVVDAVLFRIVDWLEIAHQVGPNIPTVD